MFLDSVAVERIRLHTIAWIVIALVIAEWNRFRAADAPGLQDVA
jgi:hypothetical protein